MDNKRKLTGIMACTLVAMTAIGLAAAMKGEKRDVAQKSSEASVVTNDNGTVSRTFTECTVATNGSLVTEHRRETRTTMDADGNLLESSTSEYAQSYSAGDVRMSFPKTSVGGKPGEGEAKAADSFLGLKFGAVLTNMDFTVDAEEPTLRRAKFQPAKALAGFDDYYVYVTPKTHQVVKIYACAKDEVESEVGGRRHYLIEALEKRYQTWARPRDFLRPIYSFDIGGGRYITTCLEGAMRNYETVIVAWDDALLTVAADETEEIRAEAQRRAAEKRNRRVNDAAEAF